MNKDLTVGKPEVVLWKYCIPLFGSIVFQQLYNIADSLVAGKFIGEGALAAVGNSYEVTLIYLAFAFGCNIGCSVIISQLFGAKRFGELKTAVSTTFIASGILCLALMAAGFTCSGFLLHLINTPEEIFSDSMLYLYIYTGGLLFLFFYNIATGIFSALGDSKTPFWFLAVSSVTNIFMDILFVKSFHMGIAGVAWATFICQGASSVLAVLALVRRLKQVETVEKHKMFSWELFWKITEIAAPSILQQSFISIGNIVIQSVINSFGASVIAGYAAAIKLNNFAITTFTTLGNGMSNFTAQNIGAGKLERIKRGFRGGLGMAYLIALPFILLYLFAGQYVVHIFMNGDSVDALATGVRILEILAPFYLVVATKLIADGILRGAGAMKQFMMATFTDLILRVVLAFVLSSRLGETGIWMSWPIGWTIAAIMSVSFYKSGCWKKDYGV
ncbi:MAG: MATE family efflux transporter [Lachnospiraceae bacterium]|nr:MATE family efflux transporter [Lachnospiraceae bacterium]